MIDKARLPFGSRMRKDQSQRLLLQPHKQWTASPRRRVPGRGSSAIAYRSVWQSAISVQKSLLEIIYSPCTCPTIRELVESEATSVLAVLEVQCYHVQRLCSICLSWSPVQESRRAALGRIWRPRCTELNSVISHLVL